MNEAPENFDALQKLLALKRHEQPPPGYFDRLPGLILSRLDEPEAEPEFWSRLLSGFILRPAFAYSLGLVFCGALATGIGYAVRVVPNQAASQPMSSESWGLAAQTTGLPPDGNAPRLHVAGFNGFETNSQPSLFEGVGVKTETVNFEHR